MQEIKIYCLEFYMRILLNQLSCYMAYHGAEKDILLMMYLNDRGPENYIIPVPHH
jgi:hypothetical protein